jgi:hypothetical protein
MIRAYALSCADGGRADAALHLRQRDAAPE